MFKLRHWWRWWWYFKLYGSTIFTNIGQSWKTKVNVSVGQSQIMLLAQHSVVFIKKIHLLVYNQTEHKTGEGNGTPLQYSCLENPMERGAWWAAVHGGLEELDTTERLHFHFSLSCIGEGNGNPLQCSCLESPRDGEPGGLPSVGSHRVGHDWSNLAAAKHKTVNPLWTISNTK